MIVKFTDQDKEQFNKLLESFTEKHKETKTRREVSILNDELGEAINNFYKQIELREFSKLGGDREKIMESAEEQVNLLVEDRYKDCEYWMKNKDQVELIEKMGVPPCLRVDGDVFYLDIKRLVKECRNELLVLHYEAFREKEDYAAISQLDDLVYKTISANPKTTLYKGVLQVQDKETNEVIPDVKIRTTHPDTMIIATSKLIKEVFGGDLYPGTAKRVNVQKKKLQKKNPVKTLIAVDFDDLKNQGNIVILGRRELNQFDQDIHDAITTHYVEGGNEYITDSMIYDIVTGKDGATLNPVQKEAISNAITKLMYSHVRIDASEEAKKFGIERFIYDGYLLPAERVTVSLNGTITECIHLFRNPPLYDYANKRNQIARIEIKLLNSPVNKNEETIIIQSILYRNVLRIKGPTKQNPTIDYETIYSQLGIPDLKAIMNIKDDDERKKKLGALRKKKLKVRETVKKILEYWTSEGFIKGYKENNFESVTIRY